VKTGVVGAQAPRIHCVPPYVSSAGAEAIEVAEVAGLYLDPWEKLVVTDALGETAAGRWASYRVGIEVPRQNGKGSILEARELAGMFALGERLIIHSAHEQATASEHFRRLLNLMEGVPEFDRRILKVVRGKGLESIELRDNYRIFFKTRTRGGGRGFTGDLVVFDEAMILDAAFMAALVPTMAARSMIGDPQLWFAGSAVDQQKTEHGIEFARVRADALAELERVRGPEDAPERLAYFGWNLPYDHPDEVPDDLLDDPEAWAQSNPGLNIRIAPSYVGDERRALGRREFIVERLGVGDWPETDEGAGSKISRESWNACADPDSSCVDPVCFVFDAPPDRSSAVICVAGRRDDGQVHVEVVENRPGTDWVPARLAELVESHECIPPMYDEKGPAASLAAEISDTFEVDLRPVTMAEMVLACGQFFDAVGQGTVHHRESPDLTQAVRGAATRPLGDAWAWARKTSGANIAPLVAVTLAHWGVRTQDVLAPPMIEVFG
jgi:hypothetical protein